MSELKLVSPLLDQMSVEEEIAGHNGCTCYALRHVQSGERFVVKRISVPASDLQVRALILSGAYPDDAAVHAYYGSVAEDIKNELDTGMRLAENGYFAGASSYQIEPKEDGLDMDEAFRRVSHVFGIVKLSRAVECPKDFAAICETAEAYLGETLSV
mgnify:CR=1 FL=1